MLDIYFLAWYECVLVSWGGEAGAACGEGDAEVSQRFPEVEGPMHSWGAEVARCGGPQRLMGRRGFHPLIHRLYNTSRHH